VHPLLAIVVSLLTVGFFWLTLSKALEAYRIKLAHDLETIIGQLGEVKTVINPIGSVYVAGELWTASAEKMIPVGTQVRIKSRDGLTLVVETADASNSENMS
jgi:membrane-bound serine protease (ClpP class)